MKEWTVICEPVANNEPGKKNRGGLRVILTDGDREHELSRVAFARRNSRNPDESFVVQLQHELDKAYEVAATVNELMGEFERLQEEASRKARDLVREVLGNPSKALV